MKRAFLSHSSIDNVFINSVANLLKPGTYELDALTFDAGSINSEAILRALGRSDIFCLFISNSSLRSKYVNFELAMAGELFAAGEMGKILPIIIDGLNIDELPKNLMNFNVKKAITPESAARLIQGALLSIGRASGNFSHPFIGREGELNNLESQCFNLEMPPIKVIYISGNVGSGRKSIARKCYQDNFPHVRAIIPQINIDRYFGLEEIYRALLKKIGGPKTLFEFREVLDIFERSSDEEKTKLVAEKINGLVSSNEAVFFIDDGGMLSDNGAFQKEFNACIEYIDGNSHPPIAVISRRAMPGNVKRVENDVAYSYIQSLDNATSKRIMSALFKMRGVKVNREELEELVEISDNHAANIYKIAEDVMIGGFQMFMGNIAKYYEWKNREIVGYIGRLKFTEDETEILALLSLLPELDFDTISSVLNLGVERVGSALENLLSLHVVESDIDQFKISPVLKAALGHDFRIRLDSVKRKNALIGVAKKLSVRMDGDSISISLIDSAILSSLEAGSSISSLAAAFLLPSHYVFLADRNYDLERYEEAIRFGRNALKAKGRLSYNAFKAACRYICLSALRLGYSSIFQEGLNALKGDVRDSGAKSLIAFIQGYNFRFKGNLPEAEKYFRESYTLTDKKQAPSRELAALYLAMGNLDEAERFARQSHKLGPGNVFIIDILLSTLIRKYGRNKIYSHEMDELFNLLKEIEEYDGNAFYTTRKAEFEHLWGDNKIALLLINKAVGKSPRIVDVLRLKAEILLKDGQASKAFEIINKLKFLHLEKGEGGRKSSYRIYLELYFHYLLEIGEYKNAREVYNDKNVFTAGEKDEAIRRVNVAEGYSTRR